MTARRLLRWILLRKQLLNPPMMIRKKIPKAPKNSHNAAAHAVHAQHELANVGHVADAVAVAQGNDLKPQTKSQQLQLR